MTLLSIYRDVLGSYYGQPKQQKERRFVFYHVLYRPLSFPLSALAIRVGASADGTTAFGLLVLVAALWALASGAIVWGALIFFFYYVLDFVDGNIARYHGLQSYFGKLFDGMVNSVSAAVYVAAGWAAARSGDSLLPPDGELVMGIATGMSALLRQTYRFRLAYLRLEMPNAPVRLAAESEEPGAKPGLPLPVWLFENAVASLPVMLLLAAAADALSVFNLLFFAIYALGGNLEIVLSMLKNRRALLERRDV